MHKNYIFRSLPFFIIALMLFGAVSCKKESKLTNGNNSNTVVNATPVKLGMFELKSQEQDTVFRLLLMEISQVGTRQITSRDNFGDLIFDTGSGGLVLDAHDIIDSSLFTTNGFNITGDSMVVNGITITNQKSIIEYGADAATLQKVYGNLAYANITFGDPSVSNVTIKRVPFFLYYQGLLENGKKAPNHNFDLVGVDPQYDLSFSGGAYITSPFASYTPGTGLTNGMKIAALGTSNFTTDGQYVADVVTLGLTASDLSSTSGFTMTPLQFYQGEGYDPAIQGKITYNGKTFSTYVLFDSGTEPFSYLEDPTYTGRSDAYLSANSSVSVATTSGFNYSYTVTPPENLTLVENAQSSGSDGVSIISLEYFLNNEYMLDYTNHKLGLKVD